MDKLLIITPHLSTGGLPQYLTKKIESLNDIYNIFVIEYNDITGGIFTIQKDKILKILSKKLITLGNDKFSELFSYINDINPNLIHFEEFSETFLPNNILDFIYNKDRRYKIFETSHSANFINKRYIPDGFIFVADIQIKLYQKFNTPCCVVEYPIVNFERLNRNNKLLELGQNPNLKHILNVGLFTLGKNQGEIFEYADKMKDDGYVFHFIGNLADNFKDYWLPLLLKKPVNCVVWGEKENVFDFYRTMDCFLFTSKLELNPIVIKEAIGCNIPILMYNLPIYLNKFDNIDNIKFLKKPENAFTVF